MSVPRRLNAEATDFVPRQFKLSMENEGFSNVAADTTALHDIQNSFGQYFTPSAHHTHTHGGSDLLREQEGFITKKQEILDNSSCAQINDTDLRKRYQRKKQQRQRPNTRRQNQTTFDDGLCTSLTDRDNKTDCRSAMPGMAARCRAKSRCREIYTLADELHIDSTTVAHLTQLRDPSESSVGRCVASQMDLQQLEIGNFNHRRGQPAERRSEEKISFMHSHEQHDQGLGYERWRESSSLNGHGRRNRKVEECMTGDSAVAAKRKSKSKNKSRREKIPYDMEVLQNQTERKTIGIKELSTVSIVSAADSNVGFFPTRAPPATVSDRIPKTKSKRKSRTRSLCVQSMYNEELESYKIDSLDTGGRRAKTCDCENGGNTNGKQDKKPTKDVTQRGMGNIELDVELVTSFPALNPGTLDSLDIPVPPAAEPGFVRPAATNVITDECISTPDRQRHQPSYAALLRVQRSSNSTSEENKIDHRAAERGLLLGKGNGQHVETVDGWYRSTDLVHRPFSATRRSSWVKMRDSSAPLGKKSATDTIAAEEVRLAARTSAEPDTTFQKTTRSFADACVGQITDPAEPRYNEGLRESIGSKPSGSFFPSSASASTRLQSHSESSTAFPQPAHDQSNLQIHNVGGNNRAVTGSMFSTKASEAAVRKWKARWIQISSSITADVNSIVIGSGSGAEALREVTSSVAGRDSSSGSSSNSSSHHNIMQQTDNDRNKEGIKSWHGVLSPDVAVSNARLTAHEQTNQVPSSSSSSFSTSSFAQTSAHPAPVGFNGNTASRNMTRISAIAGDRNGTDLAPSRWWKAVFLADFKTLHGMLKVGFPWDAVYAKHATDKPARHADDSDENERNVSVKDRTDYEQLVGLNMLHILALHSGRSMNPLITKSVLSGDSQYAEGSPLLCLEQLLESTLSVRCNIDIRDRRRKCTPLLLACCAGSVECVRILLRYGADCTVRDKVGDSVLHKAVQSGNGALVGFLCGKLPKRQNFSTVSNALGNGSGCSVGIGGSGYTKNGSSNSNSGGAGSGGKGGGGSISGNLAALKVNLRNKRRETPLLQARSREMVQILVQSAGADVTVRDSRGMDLACIAAREGLPDLLEAVLKSNSFLRTSGGFAGGGVVEVSCANLVGSVVDFPVFETGYLSSADCAARFSGAGGRKPTTVTAYTTPLHQACIGSGSVRSNFHADGASGCGIGKGNCKGSGRARRDQVVLNNYAKCVKILLQSGLYDVNTRDKPAGLTPLMLAAIAGDATCFKLLVRGTTGANVAAVIGRDFSAASMICEGGGARGERRGEERGEDRINESDTVREPQSQQCEDVKDSAVRASTKYAGSADRIDSAAVCSKLDNRARLDLENAQGLNAVGIAALCNRSRFLSEAIESLYEVTAAAAAAAVACEPDVEGKPSKNDAAYFRNESGQGGTLRIRSESRFPGVRVKNLCDLNPESVPPCLRNRNSVRLTLLEAIAAGLPITTRSPLSDSCSAEDETVRGGVVEDGNENMGDEYSQRKMGNAIATAAAAASATERTEGQSTSSASPCSTCFLTSSGSSGEVLWRYRYTLALLIAAGAPVTVSFLRKLLEGSANVPADTMQWLIALLPSIGRGCSGTIPTTHRIDNGVKTAAVSERDDDASEGGGGEQRVAVFPRTAESDDAAGIESAQVGTPSIGITMQESNSDNDLDRGLSSAAGVSPEALRTTATDGEWREIALLRPAREYSDTLIYSPSDDTAGSTDAHGVLLEDRCEGFEAHSFVLAACSPVLRAMCSSRWQHTNRSHSLRYPPHSDQSNSDTLQSVAAGRGGPDRDSTICCSSDGWGNDSAPAAYMQSTGRRYHSLLRLQRCLEERRKLCHRKHRETCSNRPEKEQKQLNRLSGIPSDSCVESEDRKKMATAVSFIGGQLMRHTVENISAVSDMSSLEDYHVPQSLFHENSCAGERSQHREAELETEMEATNGRDCPRPIVCVWPDISATNLRTVLLPWMYYHATSSLAHTYPTAERIRSSLHCHGQDKLSYISAVIAAVSDFDILAEVASVADRLIMLPLLHECAHRTRQLIAEQMDSICTPLLAVLEPDQWVAAEQEGLLLLSLRELETERDPEGEREAQRVDSQLCRLLLRAMVVAEALHLPAVNGVTRRARKAEGKRESMRKGQDGGVNEQRDEDECDDELEFEVEREIEESESCGSGGTGGDGGGRGLRAEVAVRAEGRCGGDEMRRMIAIERKDESKSDGDSLKTKSGGADGRDHGPDRVEREEGGGEKEKEKEVGGGQCGDWMIAPGEEGFGLLSLLKLLETFQERIMREYIEANNMSRNSGFSPNSPAFLSCRTSDIGSEGGHLPCLGDSKEYVDMKFADVVVEVQCKDTPFQGLRASTQNLAVGRESELWRNNGQPQDRATPIGDIQSGFTMDLDLQWANPHKPFRFLCDCEEMGGRSFRDSDDSEGNSSVDDTCDSAFKDGLADERQSVRGIDKLGEGDGEYGGAGEESLGSVQFFSSKAVVASGSPVLAAMIRFTEAQQQMQDLQERQQRREFQDFQDDLCCNAASNLTKHCASAPAQGLSPLRLLLRDLSACSVWVMLEWIHISACAACCSNQPDSTHGAMFRDILSDLSTEQLMDCAVAADRYLMDELKCVIETALVEHIATGCAVAMIKCASLARMHRLLLAASSFVLQKYPQVYGWEVCTPTPRDLCTENLCGERLCSYGRSSCCCCSCCRGSCDVANDVADVAPLFLCKGEEEEEGRVHVNRRKAGFVLESVLLALEAVIASPGFA